MDKIIVRFHCGEMDGEHIDVKCDSLKMVSIHRSSSQPDHREIYRLRDFNGLNANYYFSHIEPLPPENSFELPTTQPEWDASPRPVPLDPDESDLRIASTYSLSPCPFCGNKSINARGEQNRQTGIFGYHIECSNYRCFGSVFSSAMTRDDARAGAINHWQNLT